MKFKFVFGLLLCVLVVAAIMDEFFDLGGTSTNSAFEFPTKNLSKEEQTALWQQLKDEEKISWGAADFLAHNDNFVLHEGDLSIDHDFTLANGNSLIVDGNLAIAGSYFDRGTGHLVVLGDMRARNVLTIGTSVVAGRLTVDELVYCYYNDHISEFKGGVEARALFSYDKDCYYPSKTSTFEFEANDYSFDIDGHDVFRHLKPALVAASYDDYPFPDYRASETIISAGDSIFRQQPAGNAFSDAWRRLREERNGYEEFSTDDLAELARVDETLRIIIAQRDALDPKIQAQLIEARELTVLQALAKNETTTSGHLSQIAEIADATRPLMASNPSAPMSLIAKLTDDPDPSVRVAIAHRHDLNSELASKLATDKAPEIRRALTQSARR